MSHATRHRFTHNRAPMDAPFGTRLAANDNPRRGTIRFTLLSAAVIWLAGLLFYSLGG